MNSIVKLINIILKTGKSKNLLNGDRLCLCGCGRTLNES